MIIQKRVIRTLTAIGVAAIFMMPFSAGTADKDVKQAGKIKGAVVEEPVREVFNMAEMMAAMFGGADGGIACKDEGVLVKSQNAILNFDGVKLASEKGILVKSVVNDDKNATKTEGKKVYGIHTRFRAMEVSGDIVHEDKDRDMYVYLESGTVLSGAIKDGYISIDSSSKWIATADSKVTIYGDINLSQIDAPKGVTINAVAGQRGTITLPGGGTLNLKKS